MREPDQEALLQEYIQSLEYVPNNTKRSFVVGLVGVTGSGKSTVARKLAENANLFVASNDAIRRFLNSKGFEGDSPVQHVLEYMAVACGDYLDERHVSRVLDADLLMFIDTARQRAEEHGFKFYLVHIVAPDALIRERIKHRLENTVDGSGEHSRAGIDAYERRLELHTQAQLPEFDFEIHTDEPLDEQIDRLCQLFERDGVIDVREQKVPA